MIYNVAGCRSEAISARHEDVTAGGSQHLSGGSMADLFHKILGALLPMEKNGKHWKMSMKIAIHKYPLNIIKYP